MRNGTKEVKFIIYKKGTMQYLQVLRCNSRNLRGFFSTEEKIWFAVEFKELSRNLSILFAH